MEEKSYLNNIGIKEIKYYIVVVKIIYKLIMINLIIKN